jgi:PAS domain S-box-containing protein
MTARQKILIVDDRKENLFALKEVLGEIDVEVIEALSGNEALAATLHHDFAVAILDVQMPEMSGYELAEYLRGGKKTQNIPIIFLTAVYGDEQHVFKGYEAGSIDYITKPYPPKVLLSKLKIFLEMDRNRLELLRHRDHLEALVYERTAMLAERVKELKCLNAIASLVAEPGKSIEETLQAAVEIIPAGWRYPEITGARISFEGREFTSTSYQDRVWKQSADLTVSGKSLGLLEVCCLEERPAPDGSHCLPEEQNLLLGIARQIGIMIERKRGVKELLLAKEEWERTFESIGDIAMILAPDLRISRVNQQAVLAFSTTKEELQGRFCYEVFRQASQPCAGCPVSDVRRDLGVHTAEIEHKELGKILQVSVSPVFNDDGRVASIIYFAKDITARKEMEMRLIQSQKQEAIGTLAGGIAHDFNNILTPILGYSEMALMDLEPDHPAAVELAEVTKAALRAKDLVKQILTFSRQKEHQLQPLAPHLIIKEALKLLRASIPTSIEIRQQINPESGLVLADGTQLHQIIMNLCTNAYQAMRPTGGVLSVSLQPIRLESEDSKVQGLALAPGAYVVLEVGDTGCGMDQQTIAKIFDPYFTTKKQGEGTGLGLSVVHGIVKEYGGHISVYSEPGKGSTFRVYLPTIVSTGMSEAPAVAPAMARGTEKILVVDDDSTILALNTRILTELGYRVTGLAASPEALNLFTGAPQDFDLVLTDMTMPGMSGADLSLRIHAIRPDIPIILCSGFSELIDGDKAREIGIQAYLKKPFSGGDLAGIIRRLLDVAKSEAG